MRHPVAGLPFATFVQALKDLAAMGLVRVEKWPANPTDDYRVKVLNTKQAVA